VRTFGRGSELLTFLDTCNDRRLPLAMILDYRMPGLTGADVLRNTGKGTPYSTICKIVWSTSQLRKERDECLALGALQWIVKPATDGELDLAIRSLASMLLNVEKKPQFLP
jgi:CheY-like chemotaxis protein